MQKEKGIVSLVIMILLHGRKMIQYATQQAKKPVWACHYKNAASEKMAEKLGFIKVSECVIIKNKY